MCINSVVLLSAYLQGTYAVSYTGVLCKDYCGSSVMERAVKEQLLAANCQRLTDSTC